MCVCVVKTKISAGTHDSQWRAEPCCVLQRGGQRTNCVCECEYFKSVKYLDSHSSFSLLPCSSASLLFPLFIFVYSNFNLFLLFLSLHVFYFPRLHFSPLPSTFFFFTFSGYLQFLAPFLFLFPLTCPHLPLLYILHFLFSCLVFFSYCFFPFPFLSPLFVFLLSLLHWLSFCFLSFSPPIMSP